MEKKTSLHFLNNEKYRTITIACGITGIHYVVTYFLDAAKYPTLGWEIFLKLTIPSYVLSTIIDLFRWSSDTRDVVIISWESYTVPYILTSSLIYGIVMSLLVSRKPKWRWVGVVIIFIFLLILAGFWLMAAAAQSFA